MRSKKTEGENKNAVNQRLFSPSVKMNFDSSLVRGSLWFVLTFHPTNSNFANQKIICSTWDNHLIRFIEVNEMTSVENFDNVLYSVSDRVKTVLSNITPTVKANTIEIRLRAGMPLALTVGTETVFVRNNGGTQFFLSGDLFKVSEEDLKDSFRRLCNNSVFAHEKELANGYVIMKNGSRAGVCGSITQNGGFHDISSINIRIAHEVFGCANHIAQNYNCGGLLIAGPPGSGKTTVLRDLIRQLSSGVNGRHLRIAVIDSRLEISGSIMGKPTTDLGPNTDVLIIEPKAKGLEIALRTMFPDVIAFDEIATTEELTKVSESLYAGVNIITTAHIGNIGELKNRNVTSTLLQSGAINQIALLPRLHGGRIEIFDTKELYCDAVV